MYSYLLMVFSYSCLNELSLPSSCIRFIYSLRQLKISCRESIRFLNQASVLLSEVSQFEEACEKRGAGNKDLYWVGRKLSMTWRHLAEGLSHPKRCMCEMKGGVR